MPSIRTTRLNIQQVAERIRQARGRVTLAMLTETLDLMAELASHVEAMEKKVARGRT